GQTNRPGPGRADEPDGSWLYLLGPAVPRARRRIGTVPKNIVDIRRAGCKLNLTVRRTGRPGGAGAELPRLVVSRADAPATPDNVRRGRAAAGRPSAVRRLDRAGPGRRRPLARPRRRPARAVRPRGPLRRRLVRPAQRRPPGLAPGAGQGGPHD